MGDYTEESKCNIGAITTAASEIAVAPTDAQKEAIVDEASKATSAVIEQSVGESKPNANNASSWNNYPATEEEHMRRVREASNKYLASCGKLGKVCPTTGTPFCPTGRHKGYAIVDCRCGQKPTQLEVWMVSK